MGTPRPPVPRHITLDPSQVVIEWSDGHRTLLENRRLREACPCAMCKGEPPAIGPARTIPLMPAAPSGIRAVKHSLVGRYAVSFVWSDGHSSGIYPYEYLLEMCECEACTRRAPRVSWRR